MDSAKVLFASSGVLHSDSLMLQENEDTLLIHDQHLDSPPKRKKKIQDTARKRPSRFWTGAGFMIAVLALMSLIPGLIQFGVMLPRLTPLSKDMWLLFGLFDISIVFMWVNYWLALLVDPGGVDPSYEPQGLTEFGELSPTSSDVSNQLPSPHSHNYNDTGDLPTSTTFVLDTSLIPLKHSLASQSAQLATLPTPRFCLHCQKHKPPRSHHCKRCGRCILRMDHHCPWIANCVGFRNQAHFVRFLFWTLVSCWMALFMSIWRLADGFEALTGTKPNTKNMTESEAVCLIVSFVMLVPVISLVSMLGYNQGWYVLTNQTTIEAVEKRDSPTPFFNPHDGSFTPPLRDPYDFGSSFLNIASVLAPYYPPSAARTNVHHVARKHMLRKQQPWWKGGVLHRFVDFGWTLVWLLPGRSPEAKEGYVFHVRVPVRDHGDNGTDIALYGRGRAVRGRRDVFEAVGEWVGGPERLIREEREHVRSRSRSGMQTSLNSAHDEESGGKGRWN